MRLNFSVLPLNREEQYIKNLFFDDECIYLKFLINKTFYLNNCLVLSCLDASNKKSSFYFIFNVTDSPVCISHLKSK